MMNTFKVLQMNTFIIQIKKKSSGFFSFMKQTKALKWDFRNYAAEGVTFISWYFTRR